MHVNVEALNFRSAPIAPSVSPVPDNRIGILHLCQPVEVTGDSDVPGWVALIAEVDGQERDGFVNAGYLREPVADAQEALIAEAIREWLRFEKGLGHEMNDPYAGYVGEMWRSIGLNLDGTDRDQPWSAAAISFMVRNAGTTHPKYDGFKFAAAHAKYMHDSIHREEAGDSSSPFFGYRLHMHRPRLGDMVCRWRETPRDFDDARASDSFKSHCDIVVQITPDEVFAIGGNVSHSVSITRYLKTASGFLADSDGVIVHLVNMVE